MLHAHASLMRELATELAMKARLPLGDFDVLAQLACAGGELRMTELASQGIQLAICHDPPGRPPG